MLKLIVIYIYQLAGIGYRRVVRILDNFPGQSVQDNTS